MKAVKRFDHSMGVRLISYALHWIRAEIHEFVIKNWRIVKVATTKAQRKLFFNLRRLAKSNTINEKEAKIIAEELDVTYKDVRTMEQRLNNFDQAYDTPAYHSQDNEDWGSPASFLEDKSANPAQLLEDETYQKNQKRSLYSALKTLDARSQDILSERWLGEQKATLKDLAKRYDISMERVRQLEKNALSKLRKEMEKTTH